jgi:hypothetical protein
MASNHGSLCLASPEFPGKDNVESSDMTDLRQSPTAFVTFLFERKGSLFSLSAINLSFSEEVEAHFL